MQHVVIIGGGFAGINLARELAKGKQYRITIVDRNNYNFFPPLLYQVATGYLEPSNISYPYRKLLRNKSLIRFRMGELERVDFRSNTVYLNTGELSYDHLVFATGAESNYFGMPDVRRNALPMKTINDALALRNHFLGVLEEATVTKDEGERKKLLTFVIAGGGPTGVEVAGMLADMKKTVIRKDYPELSGQGFVSHIYLIDVLETVLKPMSEKSQKDTHAALEKMGVEIKTGWQITGYENDLVTFKNGESISTKTVVWAAGVTGSVFEGIAEDQYGRGKRLVVDSHNKLTGTQNVYAIGDTCLMTTEKGYETGHPQLAQVAIQQGKTLAANLTRLATGKPLVAFSYNDKGSMAIIGRNKAVADIPKPSLHFRGFIAWLMWIFVHLVSLIHPQNVIRTLYNWMIAYFTKDQAFRMIIKPSHKPNPSSSQP